MKFLFPHCNGYLSLSFLFSPMLTRILNVFFFIYIYFVCLLLTLSQVGVPFDDLYLAYAAFARSSTHTPRNWVKLQAFYSFVCLVEKWTAELERHRDHNEKTRFVHLCRAGDSSLSGLLANIQSASHDLDGEAIFFRPPGEAALAARSPRQPPLPVPPALLLLLLLSRGLHGVRPLPAPRFARRAQLWRPSS